MYRMFRIRNPAIHRVISEVSPTALWRAEVRKSIPKRPRTVVTFYPVRSIYQEQHEMAPQHCASMARQHATRMRAQARCPRRRRLDGPKKVMRRGASSEEYAGGGAAELLRPLQLRLRC